MRPPNILDLVEAVSELAPAHSEVAAWWYTRVADPGSPAMVVVIESSDGSEADCAAIAGELQRRLGPGAVAVRPHRAADEARTLYRLLTAPGRRTVTAGPREETA